MQMALKVMATLLWVCRWGCFNYHLKRNNKMKIIIVILISLFMALSSQAQTKPKFNIKIVSKSGHTTRGLLYAVGEKEIIMLKHEKDTLKINFKEMKHLYVKRRGVILPIILAGAVAFVIVATQSTNPLLQVVNIIAGVPIGVAIGAIVGQLFANKRFYRHIEAGDFTEISGDLQKYTQISFALN